MPRSPTAAPPRLTTRSVPIEPTTSEGSLEHLGQDLTLRVFKEPAENVIGGGTSLRSGHGHGAPPSRLGGA